MEAIKNERVSANQNKHTCASILLPEACKEARDNCLACQQEINAELLKALELAEATVMRLERHAPGSANGTLDVIRAAIRKAKG